MAVRKKKGKKKSAGKRVQPPKVAGGGGFAFEDKVAAYFLSCLLVGLPPLDPKLGIISKISFQTRVDGWLIDDLLLTIKSEAIERRCAISIKSNQQFTRNGAKKEFVGLAWRQFLNRESTVFNKRTDLLGITTTSLPADLNKQLQELLEWAKTQDPAKLPSRLAVKHFGSALKRKLFASFSCPRELSEKHGITDKNTGELLSCIRVLPFDFNSDPSEKTQSATQNCQNILESGTLAEATKLWESLLAIAAENKPNVGFLDLPKLLDNLRTRYKLKNYPAYEADWSRLQNQTRHKLENINDKIGGKIFVPREKLHTSIQGTIDNAKAIVLLGPSGCGKSVIAKSWAENQQANHKVLWWDYKSFEVNDFASFESTLKLDHPLHNILDATPDSQSYLVLDGIDRLETPASFSNVSTLISAFGFDQKTTPWRLIITCRPEEWFRVQHEIGGQLPGKLEIIQVQEFEQTDLKPVLEAFPTMRSLFLHHHLFPLLSKPKILDLIATQVSFGKTIDPSKWVGESDFIEWFWENEVEGKTDGQARARFLTLLAEKQADELQSRTPTTEFTVSDLHPVDGLIKDRICRQQEEALSFDHDLVGDWARQRILVGKAANLRTYFETRLSSPMWHKAVRLYGLCLLEKHKDLNRWKKAMRELAPEENELSLAQDLLIEAVIFAANPLPILDRLWPELKANKGELLNRMLRRFLHVATLPNPRVITFLKLAGQDQDYETEAATLDRLPYWPYWLPILRFLHTHIDEVIQLACEPVAEIADTWLRLGREKWPLRKEAARLGLATGKCILSFKKGGEIRIVEDKLDEIAYKAALAGAKELPDEVANFALEACERRGPNGQERKEPDKSKRVMVVHSHMGRRELVIPPPWPDGPHERIDSAFCKICLEGNALLPLIISNAKIAAEVILALLIEEPKPKDDYYVLKRPSDDFGVKDEHRWFPPFYIRGPFLFFLNHYPNEAIKLILRLVNFATDRFAANFPDCRQVIINLPGSDIALSGDKRVYYWYRDYSPCPNPVVCALMALEKWFYDELDGKQSIDEHLLFILQNSTSVAFAGLLSAVGCKKPPLFDGPLQPLLGVAEFHLWELEYSVEHQYSCSGVWWNQPELLIRLAQEWHKLPHRERNLRDLALQFFLNIPQIRPFFEKARSSWIKQLENVENDNRSKKHLEQLIAVYDIDKWQTQLHQDHGNIWVFEEPKQEREKRESELQKIGNVRYLIAFPTQCRQILDENKPIEEERLEEFWGTLRNIAKQKSQDITKQDIACVESAVCGGLAVLFQLHRDWLRKYPAREKWCLKQLMKIIQNPPRKEGPYLEYDKCTWTWDSFCAQIIPILWAENPEDGEFRWFAASFASHPRYKTVELLFASAFKFRMQLKDHFKQLQHFTLRWAALRWQLMIARNQVSQDENKIRRKVAKRWDREISAFVKGKISATIPEWKEVAAKNRQRKKIFSVYDGKQTRAYLGLDESLLQSIYSWLPTLDQATNENERKEWINIWRKFLDLLIWTLGEDPGEDIEIEGTPYPWDYWVLDKISPIILQLRDSEEPEYFWKQILNLGSRCHYWVNHFLEDWFIFNLSPTGASDAFVREWRKMVEFAFSLPKWESNHRSEEMWLFLMGIFSFYGRGNRYWTRENRAAIRQMKDLYQKWARVHLRSQYSASHFINFLAYPAAEPLLLDALIWLRETACEASDHYWGDKDMRENLAKLLNHCWRSYQSTLRQNRSAFDAFKALLKVLVDHQDSIALVLQDHISRES